MTKNSALSPEDLRRVFDAKDLDFKSTEELPILDEVIGQERAVRAVSFGIDIESPGYNMYALGPVGTGKTTTIKKFLRGKAREQPVPKDWLYVNNFEDQDRPKALSLPAGKGCEFEKDMDQLVENLQADVPQSFEGEQYEKEQERIQGEFQEKRQELFEEADHHSNPRWQRRRRQYRKRN